MPVRLALSLTCFLALGACADQNAAGNQAGNAPPAGSASAGGTVSSAPAPTSAKTLLEGVGQSADHTTLGAAVKAAGLEKVLAGAGPYTVFAPTNAAFAQLPAGAAEGLMRPESKAALTGILTYHVVPGVVTAADLRAAIRRRGGKTELATVRGGKLTIAEADGALVITDAKGGQSRVTQGDILQSNGVIHVVDAVLMPR
ncbi:MAG TPA: fasciclin domain-containing protein [Allosphingosinicella sp.]|jgi:uncharacterized surface protein with fasciclin (FAS1) repeats|uniref:fasciclin domain-containing protein n=1 Tax=Allosphingosinicella sp. TaxID=2823234 RepID=UPI002F2784F2